MTPSRSAVVALLAMLSLPFAALAEEEAPHPTSVPGARLYAGGASAQSDSGGSAGGGAVIGFQSFIGKGGALNSFWGIEVLGVKVGQGFLPVITGDFGLRLMPWPEGFVRPFLKAGLGLSLLLILPVPSLTLGLGLGIPLGREVVIDVSLTVRRAFNIFDVNNSLNIGVFEVGIGF